MGKSLKYDILGRDKKNVIAVLNGTGSTILGFRVLKVIGYTSDYQEAELVSNTTDFPVGITLRNILDGKVDEVLRIGSFTFDTSAQALNDPVYFTGAGLLSFSDTGSKIIGYVTDVGVTGKIYLDLNLQGGGAGGGIGTSDGLVYSPSVSTGSLKSGQYNNWALLIADLNELAIKKVYFTEDATIPKSNYYDCEFVGYIPGNGVARVSIVFSGSETDELLPHTIRNISLVATNASESTQTISGNRFLMDNSYMELRSALSFSNSTINFTMKNNSSIDKLSSGSILSSSVAMFRVIQFDVFGGGSIANNALSNWTSITIYGREVLFDSERPNEMVFPVIGSVTKAVGGVDPIITKLALPKVKPFSEIVTTAKANFTLPLSATDDNVIIFVDGAPQFSNFSVSDKTLTFDFNVNPGQVVNGWVISL